MCSYTVYALYMPSDQIYLIRAKPVHECSQYPQSTSTLADYHEARNPVTGPYQNDWPGKRSLRLVRKTSRSPGWIPLLIPAPRRKPWKKVRWRRETSDCWCEGLPALQLTCSVSKPTYCWRWLQTGQLEVWNDMKKYRIPRGPSLTNSKVFEGSHYFNNFGSLMSSFFF